MTLHLDQHIIKQLEMIQALNNIMIKLETTTLRTDSKPANNSSNCCATLTKIQKLDF